MDTGQSVRGTPPGDKLPLKPPPVSAQPGERTRHDPENLAALQTPAIVDPSSIRETALHILDETTARYRHELDVEKRRLWVVGIADYSDRPTWRKVHGAFEVEFPNSELSSVPVAEYNTLEVGVHVSHYALAPAHYRPPTQVIFTNAARIRTDDTAKRSDSLVLAVLENQSLVFAYMNGEELGFVHDKIKAAFVLDSDDRDVDFRSRDILPRIMKSVIAGERDFIKSCALPEQLADIGVVPAPRWVVGWVDKPYMNIKTPIRVEDPTLAEIPFGSLLYVRIGEAAHWVRFQASIARLEEHELGLVRSSDSEHDGSKKTPHMVLAVKGSHAWSTFLEPKAGTPIELLQHIPADAMTRYPLRLP